MKCLSLIIACLISIGVSAAEPIYVIFTSNSNKESNCNVRHSRHDKSWDPEIFRYPMHSFFVRNRECNLYKVFEYVNYKDDPEDIKVISKPIDFLDNIQCIDLDIELPKLDRAQALKLRNQLVDRDNVYFIDRNDFTDSTILIIPVRGSAHRDVIIVEDE